MNDQQSQGAIQDQGSVAKTRPELWSPSSATRPIYVLIDDALAGPIKQLDKKIRGILNGACYRVVGYESSDDILHEASVSRYGPLALVVIDQDFSLLTFELLLEFRQQQLSLPFLFLGESPVDFPAKACYSIAKPITDPQHLKDIVAGIISSLD